MNDNRWLLLMCASRAGFSLIFTAYSAVIPLVQQAWGMSSGEAGLVQSGWHAGYLVSLFGAGLLADRHGARNTFLATSGAACVSALLFAALAQDFVSALALHFLAGACSGGSYSPGLTLLAQRFDPSRRGFAMGCYLAAASFGYALSLIGSGLLAPALGWRAALFLAAAGTFAGAAFGWQALRRVRNVVHSGAQARSWRSAAERLRHNRPAKLAIGAYSLHCWELLGLWAWLPAYLVAVAAGGGNGGAGALTAGIAIAGAVHLVSVASSIAGGLLSDRIGRTRVILMMSCASLVFSFTFGWMTGCALWLVALAAMAYNFAAIGDSAVLSTVLTETVPDDYIGFAFSVRSVLGFGMGALSPWVFGLALDAARSAGLGSGAGWGLAWGMLGLVALPGPLMTLRLQGIIGRAGTVRDGGRL